MTPAEISALHSRIQAIENTTVRGAALNAFAEAGTGGLYGYERVQSLLDKSARVDGKTAIFYSGESGANQQKADDCKDQLDGKGYKIGDTQAGEYVQEIAGGLTKPFGDSLWSLASAMMADQAVGPVIAFVAGNVSNASTWMLSELPALLQNGSVPSINGFSRDALQAAADSVQNGNPIDRAQKMVASSAQCFDPDDFPPTGGVAEPNPLVTKIWGAASKLADGILEYGPWVLGGIAVAACASQPECLAIAGVLVLLTKTSSGEPKAPEAGSDYLSKAEQSALLAAQVASELAYMGVAAAVAGGSLPAATLAGFTQSQRDLEATRALLDSNGGEPLNGTVLGADGNPIDISVKSGLAAGSISIEARPANDAGAGTTRTEFDAGGANEWLSKTTVTGANGDDLAETIVTDSGTTVSQSRDTTKPSGDPNAWKPVVVRDPWGNEIAGGEIGSILGSSIGNAIAGGNVFGQIAASSVLGALLQNVGQTFGYALDHNVSLTQAAYTTFENFDVELAQQVHSAGIGALTSYLTAELAESLGNDFGGQLVKYVVNSGTNTVLDFAIGNVARARAAAALAHPRQGPVPGPARSGPHVGCGAAANDNGSWTYILAA